MKTPFGYCECGCGERTNLAASSNARRGHIKGQPLRFVANHAARVLYPAANRVPKPRKSREYPERTPVADRLNQKLVRRGDCWEWTGKLNPSGYGQVIIHPARGVRETWLTHRLAYTLEHGPIPDGLTVDHLCRNRVCANPSHMELVTQRENNLRSTSPSAKNARKTHCKRGHEFTPENTYLWTGPRGQQRQCRECISARTARSYASADEADL